MKQPMTATPSTTDGAFLDLTDELVNVTAIPSSEYALNGVQNTLHVLFQVKTGSRNTNNNNNNNNNNERPPCDLCVVLDRSGSMQGEKINNCKEAIKQVIRKLTYKDKLHLIMYDTTAEVLFENGDLEQPEALEKMVDSINVKYATNLHEGLELGAETLKKYKIEGSSRVQRIFLFSDGLVNKGKKTPAQIAELVQNVRKSGISISSFGIGSDFDEELMKSISENGSGDYFFIENASVIPKYVEKGLRGLLSLVGTGSVLKIRGKNGAVVKKIYAHDDVIAGAKLGDLKQNNLRQIVSVVELSPQKGEGEDVVTWTLSYVPEGEKDPISLQGSVYIKFTDDDSLLSTKNPAVEVARAMQEIGDSDLHVLTLLDKGKRKEAIELKQKDLGKLKALEPLDPTGTIKVLREKTEKSLANMIGDAKDSEVRKEVHYNGYLQRRNSAYAIFD